MNNISNRPFSFFVSGVSLAVVILGAANDASAATTLPFTFSSGTTAKASEVNANFTALATAIDATNTCTGNSANDVMVKVGPLCVDKYEASIWSAADGTGTAYGVLGSQTAYPGTFPANGNWTTALYAISKPGVLPSSGVTWFQAQQACALSGKRLLTNAEWQLAAAGTPDPGTDDNATDCVVGNTSALNTGSRSKCVSKWEVNDMVGNVHEWVADWMQGDTVVWAPSTGTAGANYGGDDMYGTNPASVQGAGNTNFPAALLRGGAWSNTTYAGVFSLRASIAPSSSASTFGFRCGR